MRIRVIAVLLLALVVMIALVAPAHVDLHLPTAMVMPITGQYLSVDSTSSFAYADNSQWPSQE
jgi:hypothetical protein